MKFFRTIKFRLTVWFLIAILFILASFGVFAYFVLSYNLYQNLDNYLSKTTTELEKSLAIQDGIITITQKLSDLVLFYDANGKQIGIFGPNITFINIDGLVKKALIGEHSYLTTTSTEQQEMRLYGSPFIDGPNRYAIVIGRSTSEIKDVLNTYLNIIWISALSIIILGGLLSLFLANRVLAPVDKMVRTARDISDKDLRKRIPVTTDDELGRLASTLNQMIAGLEKSFNRQRQFASDASHELRTPLSVIQAETSLVLSADRTADEYKRSIEVVNEESNHMAAIINKLLFIVRCDAGKEPLNLQEINLREFLTEISGNISLLAEDKGIKCSLGQMEEVTLMGDRVKLKQVFNNILDNAIRYTPSYGLINISLRIKNNYAVTTISDTGLGIPADHIPLIFERFHRVDVSRSQSEGGSGLGLAIAKSIVEEHGGKIEVESEVKKGTIFNVLLPVK